MKLTPWFTPDQKPVRIGFYETKLSGMHGLFFSYWNGNKWSVGWDSLAKAASKPFHDASYQDKSWRGILK